MEYSPEYRLRKHTFRRSAACRCMTSHQAQTPRRSSLPPQPKADARRPREGHARARSKSPRGRGAPQARSEKSCDGSGSGAFSADVLADEPKRRVSIVHEKPPMLASIPQEDATFGDRKRRRHTGDELAKRQALRLGHTGTDRYTYKAITQTLEGPLSAVSKPIFAN